MKEDVMALTELQASILRANRIFEQDELRLPVSPDWSERLDRDHTVSSRALTVFDYRRWQAKELGFKQVELKYLVDDLMCSRHTDYHRGEDDEKTVYDWVYNHHNCCQDKKRWHRHPSYWTRMGRKGLFEWLPFGKKMEWQCRLVKLNDLSQEIPYEVILRILEVKTLNIFNCFHVIEPIYRANRTFLPKPIFLATIWELPPKREETGKFVFTTVGYEAHFFLSHWCDE
jgi:hypothetical protein